MKRSAALVLALLTVGSLPVAQADNIRVTFAGTISQTNPGPLQPGAAFSGGFIIDVGVERTGTSIFTWPGAVTDFRLQAGDVLITANAGRYRQFGGGFIDGNFTNPGAVIDPLVIPDPVNEGSDFVLTGISWDWRTSFPEGPGNLLEEAALGDFGFRRIDLSWANPSASVIQRGTVLSSFSELTFTVIPLPAAAWLFISGLGLLAMFRRRASRAA
ncbi:MAG: VPLPA-CTERM sorting domain-containing protein [Chromatiales bacterium]|nr:VPLPA-CTERM sorting domain-containing protein [Chromatiales bacterium]